MRPTSPSPEGRTSWLAGLAVAARACLRGFGRAQGGQVAVMFAVSALTLVTAVGGGIDLSRAFVARQQLFHAATLTCQYSARPQVVAVAYQNGSGQAAYVSQVDGAARNFVTAQSNTLAQTNPAPFTYVQGGSSSVSMAAAVPTYFMGLAGVRTMPVSTLVTCANGIAQADDTQPSMLVKESFEYSACSGVCWSTFSPTGRSGVNASVASPTPTNAPPGNYGYTGQSGNQWTVTGYCLEVDHTGVIKSSVADGSYSAELDCDNGSGTAGNSSISTRSYMSAGNYELRYNYSGRIKYYNYSPTYLCGSTDDDTPSSDLGWANDNSSPTGVVRTNQVNVYLDQDTGGAPPKPPTHTTIDGTQQLAGSNLIDECVYSDSWIERSVKITVTTAGYYWLSFAADGANDSYGGQIDNIRLCRGTCSGAVSDNYPSAWSNAALFEDTFEAPSFANGSQSNANGMLNQSYGTSGGASGWPSQSQSGWGIGGYNQVDVFEQQSPQGTQSLELDATLAGGQSTSNRYISRNFYLDPGYYLVSYYYESNYFINGYNLTTCNYAPNNLSVYNNTSTVQGTSRLNGGTYYFAANTNSVAVMMASNQLMSYPNVSSTLNAAATWTNPNGSVTSTPTYDPSALNLATFNGTQNNALIDICGVANSAQLRTAYVQITKPSQYQLVLAAVGAADNAGGVVDDVKLTALNSLYGTAPSVYARVPTAGPVNGSSRSFTGFSIIADPLTP